MKRPSNAFLFSMVLCSIFGGCALVGASYLLSRFMLKIQRTTEHTISVKGVAEKTVLSDLGSFSCSLCCKSADIAGGYRELQKLAAKLDQKLRELGFSADEVDDCSLDYCKVSKTVRTKVNNQESTREEFSHYLFTRRCRIRSTDVKKISAASLKLFELTADGIEISVSQPSYFISNPEQYKLQLIDEASQSARIRAEKAAASCGGNLGNLLTARQGVIQITRPADNSSSDGGVYDTKSIPKIIRMVVTLTFSLK